MRRILALTVSWLALAGSAHAGPAAEETAKACAACPLIEMQVAAEDRVAAADRCLTVIGVMGELADRRDAFHQRPLYVDLFPLIYWRITAVELAALARGEAAHPIEMLDEVVVFFDAWAANRRDFDEGRPVEPHWKRHYDLAAEAEADFGAIGEGSAFDSPDAVNDVLASAIKAHVDFDLARAIRASREHRFHPALTDADLAVDFAKVDAQAASDLAGREIFEVVRATSKWNRRLLSKTAFRWMNRMVKDETDGVVEGRRKAWEIAVGAGPLPTGDAPQPAWDHAALLARGRQVCAPA